MHTYTLKRLPAALASTSFALMISHAAYAQSRFETPEYQAQFGLDLINAAQAYEQGYTGKGVTVGVIDSGINASHPEFQGQLLGGYEMDTNLPIIPGAGNYDDESEGHGSHVSGIIAARKDGVGMHGVAFDAKLWVLKPESDLGDAFRLAAEQKLKIVNLSLGLNDCSDYATHMGQSTDPYCNVTDYTDAIVQGRPDEASAIDGLRAMQEAGTLLVLATGNESQGHPDILGGAPHLYPELKDNFIAVTSVDADGTLAGYSNKCGVAADWCLSAPGGVEQGDGGYGSINSVDSGGGYVGMDGTSMAAPHVAGAAAMVAQAFPYFTAYQLQQTLLTTATNLGDRAIYGWGMLDVGKAVKGPGKINDVFDLDTQGTHTHFANDIGSEVNGTLIKDGAGSLELSGYNDYMQTLVRGGKLIVNGTQAYFVTVEQAGTLGGNGRIAVLKNEGTINPGNSIGTLTVEAEFRSTADSRIQIEVDAEGRYDRIHVEGDADIQNATLEMLGGSLRPTASYQFLTVDGDLDGQFNPKVELNSVFLDTQLDTQSNEISLNIARNATAFSQYTQGPNQTAVANALDALSAAPVSSLQPLYDSILNSNGSTLAALGEQISGEVHSSVQSALVQSEWQWSQNIMQQSRAQRQAGALGRPVWAQIQTAHTTLAGRNGLADLKHERSGVALGVQFELNSTWSMGGALSYNDGKSSLKSRAESVHSNSYSAALYTSAQWTLNQGQLNWLGGVGYSHHGLNSRRALNAVQAQTLKSDSSSRNMQLFTELGWAVPLGAASSVEPYVGLNWVQMRSGAFDETGGPLALSAASERASTSSFSLGLRSTTAIDLGSTNIKLDAGVSWRHAMGRRTAQRDLALLANPAVGFTAQGASLAKDMAEVDLGARIRVGRQTDISLQYRGGYAQAQRQHAGMFSLQSRF